MVSSLDLSWTTVHVGVMRRSVRKPGSVVLLLLLLLLPLLLAEVMMTEMSAGVGWNAIFISFGKSSADAW